MIGNYSKWYLKYSLMIVFAGAAFGTMAQGRVGVNTTTPLAGMHAKGIDVLFSSDTSSNPTRLPDIGFGSRMMWYHDKAAFRVGRGVIFEKDSVGYFSVAIGSFVNASGIASVSMGRGTNAYGEASFSMGLGTYTEGRASVAMGENSFAPADHSTALGFATAAIGMYAISTGKNTKASGLISTAMGEFTVASGARSFATGLSSLASGANSTAMGKSSLASGLSSSALGDGTDAVGSYATAMGLNSKATGYTSTATGNLTVASGDNSTSMGLETTAAAYGSVSIGRYNDPVAASTAGQWVTTDPIFIVGNGTFSSRRNALVVAKNGETGINVATGMPQAMLHIKAREANNDRHIRLEAYNSTNFGNIFYNNDFLFRNNTSGGDFYFVNSGGISVLAMFSTGNMTIAGVLTQNSDERLKKNITPLDNSLEKILQVGGYHYQWNEDYRDQSIQTGLLAQQIETTMPELVSTSAEGVKSVNYSGMIPYLVEAMKELKAQNDLLKKEVIALKSNKR